LISCINPESKLKKIVYAYDRVTAQLHFQKLSIELSSKTTVTAAYWLLILRQRISLHEIVPLKSIERFLPSERSCKKKVF